MTSAAGSARIRRSAWVASRASLAARLLQSITMSWLWYASSHSGRYRS